MEIGGELDGVFVLDDQKDFWKVCGVRFEIDKVICNAPPATRAALLRRSVPGDVAVVTNREAEDGRVFEDIYLVCCRRGRVFAYKAF